MLLTTPNVAAPKAAVSDVEEALSRVNPRSKSRRPVVIKVLVVCSLLLVGVVVFVGFSYRTGTMLRVSSLKNTSVTKNSTDRVSSTSSLCTPSRATSLSAREAPLAVQPSLTLFQTIVRKASERPLFTAAAVAGVVVVIVLAIAIPVVISKPKTVLQTDPGGDKIVFPVHTSSAVDLRPIIGGSVAGGVVLILLGAGIWAFCTGKFSACKPGPGGIWIPPGGKPTLGVENGWMLFYRDGDTNWLPTPSGGNDEQYKNAILHNLRLFNKRLKRCKYIPPGNYPGARAYTRLVNRDDPNQDYYVPAENAGDLVTNLYSLASRGNPVAPPLAEFDDLLIVYGPDCDILSGKCREGVIYNAINLKARWDAVQRNSPRRIEFIEQQIVSMAKEAQDYFSGYDYSIGLGRLRLEE